MKSTNKKRCAKAAKMPIIHIVFCLIFSTFIFASCNNEKETDNSDFTVCNNSDELAPRFYSYQGTFDGSWAGAGRNTNTKAVGLPGFPTAPVVPGGTIDASQIPSWGETQKDKDYLLEENQTFKGDLNLNDCVFYVKGNMTINNAWGGSGKSKIVVLPQGSLTIAYNTLDNVIIENYGTINLPSDFVINFKASLLSNQDLVFNKLSVGGQLIVNNSIKAKEITMNVNSEISAQCIVSENKIDISNNTQLKVYSYLETKDLFLSSNAHVYINEKGWINAGHISVENSSCSIENIGNSYSVIKTDKLTIKHQNVKKIFIGWLDIHATSIENLSGHELDFLSSIIFDGKTYIPAFGCGPAFGEGQGSQEPELKLEHIGELIPSGELSATCIQWVDQIAYVSYHLRGEKYSALLDAVNSSTPALISSLRSNNYDFNHIALSEDKRTLWIAGGESKSGKALLGKLDIGSGIFSANTEINKTYLKGTTGKCVVSHKDNIYTVSGANGAFQVFSNEMQESTEKALNTGYGKHIDVNGDKIICLTGTEPAVIKVFPLSEAFSGTAENEFELGSITPIDGKNVCKLYDGVIYACMGKNGVKAIDASSGTVLHQYTETIITSFANGLDVDDKYVYVANGDALLILDKNTFEEVASYSTPDASANYVSVSNGLIGVAYGLKGCQFFRLERN